MAIAALRQFKKNSGRAVTVCGMNQGAANVGSEIYRRNPAFKDAMKAVDRIIPLLTEHEKTSLLTVYSSGDSTVRPHHTLIDDVTAYDLRIPQHNLAILSVLFWRYRLILKMT